MNYVTHIRETISQADVNKRIIIGWMKWKEVSRVMCYRKMPVELKDKAFKTIIRPAMTAVSECWAVKKKDENKLNSAEMRMLRWALGKTRLDHIRNEDIRKEAHLKHVVVRRQKPIFGVMCAISGNSRFFAFFTGSWYVDEIWPGWEVAIGLAFSESKMAANLQHTVYLDVPFVLDIVEW